MISEGDVENALKAVLDPCSRFNGTMLSVVDLGFISRITVGPKGRVGIELFLDDPICIYIYEIQRHIREAVEALNGCTSVEITMKGDDIWTEDNMTAKGRSRLENHRAHMRRRPEPVEATSGARLPIVGVRSGGQSSEGKADS